MYAKIINKTGVLAQCKIDGGRPRLQEEKMRKILLMSSALVLLSGSAEAACIQTPTCGAMGYDSTIACEGGIKCPFGNAWNCTLANKIAQIEITIEKLEQTVQDEALSKCKIGDILYSDMSCNANVVIAKTPIGVIFDITNKLAVGLGKIGAEYWSIEYFDVPGLSNITSFSAVTGDWQGKKNTQIMLEYCKANGKRCPAFEYVNSYKTEGTKAGDWYLPALGELYAIYGNMGVLNVGLAKAGGTRIAPTDHWSSTKRNVVLWNLGFADGYYNASNHYDTDDVRPVLAF